MIYDSAETDVVSPAPDGLFEPGPVDDRPPPPSQPTLLERPLQALRHFALVVKRDPLDALLMALPVAVLLVGAWVHRFINEDGFINFHVVQQIDAGNGPVFNPGERVEAYTSPLFIVVLTVVRAIIGWAVSLPKIAVGVGLVFTTSALVLGMSASRRVATLAGSTFSGATASGSDGAATDRPRLLYLPIGALLLACSPPMWRWATSGLETSLSFFWLALCFWGLVRRHDRARADGMVSAADRPRWLLIWIGLGVLVRPEFVLFTLCFLAAFWLTSQSDWASRARGLGWALGIPLLYQIFRMGYFGLIVPNTALAKNSDATHWDRGFDYLRGFLEPHTMWLALLAVATLVVTTSWATSRVDRKMLIVVLSPVAGMLLNVLYIQKVGGDYMYARFYMPALVAFVLPVAVIAVPRARSLLRGPAVLVTLAAAAVIVMWSVVAAVNGKILDANTGLVFGDYGMLLPGQQNPVEPEDYGFMVIAVDNVLAQAARQPNVLIDTSDASHQPIPLQPGQGIVVKSGAIGVTSYVAGPDIWFVDDRGLADTLGARLYPNTAFGYAGHEKLLSWDWVVARWTVPQPGEPERVRVARRVLDCPDLRDLADATTEPMSVSRFVKNIALSKKLSSMRIFDSPSDSEKQFCGDGS